jgi:hypothetical protein
VAHAAGLAPERALDVLARVEQRLRLVIRLDPDARVEERRLVEDLADRVGVVRRRRREDGDAVTRQRVDGGLEVRAAVADVRAEP